MAQSIRDFRAAMADIKNQDSDDSDDAAGDSQFKVFKSAPDIDNESDVDEALVVELPPPPQSTVVQQLQDEGINLTQKSTRCCLKMRLPGMIYGNVLTCYLAVARSGDMPLLWTILLRQ
jgi:hypothetical protein